MVQQMSTDNKLLQALKAVEAADKIMIEERAEGDSILRAARRIGTNAANR